MSATITPWGRFSTSKVIAPFWGPRFTLSQAEARWPGWMVISVAVLSMGSKETVVAASAPMESFAISPSDLVTSFSSIMAEAVAVSGQGIAVRGWVVGQTLGEKIVPWASTWPASTVIARGKIRG